MLRIYLSLRVDFMSLPLSTATAFARLLVGLNIRPDRAVISFLTGDSRTVRPIDTPFLRFTGLSLFLFHSSGASLSVISSCQVC
jgi:hypothetical protein